MMGYKKFLVQTLFLLVVTCAFSSNVIGQSIKKQLCYDTTLGDSVSIELPICLEVGNLYFDEEIDTLAFFEIDTLSMPLNGAFPFYDIPVMPIKGNVISKFGRRRGRMHTGTDVKSVENDSIFSVLGGVVTRATYYYGYGNLIAIDHGHSFETYYSHLSKMNVKVGDTLRIGQYIGKQGATGRASCRHLHFETRFKGVPYNPELLFDFNNLAFNAKGFDKFTPSAVAQSKPSTTPSSTSVATTITEGDKVIHVISQGDTLYKLAKRYGTSVKTICALNNMSETTVLKLGRRLVVKS